MGAGANLSFIVSPQTDNLDGLFTVNDLINYPVLNIDSSGVQMRDSPQFNTSDFNLPKIHVELKKSIKSTHVGITDQNRRPQ